MTGNVCFLLDFACRIGLWTMKNHRVTGNHNSTQFGIVFWKNTFLNQLRPTVILSPSLLNVLRRSNEPMKKVMAKQRGHRMQMHLSKNSGVCLSMVWCCQYACSLFQQVTNHCFRLSSFEKKRFLIEALLMVVNIGDSNWSQTLCHDFPRSEYLSFLQRILCERLSTTCLRMIAIWTRRQSIL